MSDFTADANVVHIPPVVPDEALARDQIDRAARAQTILDDPLVKEAFEAIERRVFDAWKGSSNDEGEHRENMYLLLRVQREFRHEFETLIKTGESAQQRKDAVNEGDPYV